MKRKLKSRHEFYYLRELKKSSVVADTVLLESTHGKDFSGHVFYVTKYLVSNYPNLKIRVAIHKDKMDWVRNLFERHGIQNVEIIQFLSKDYVRSLANSEILINDTSFWAYFNKRPEQTYINIWHGTPLKCLGKDNKIDGFGNVQKNFLASDYLVFSNEYTKDKMVSSYNMEGIASTKIIVGPSPRNSILFDKIARKNIRKDLEVENSKVYLYMPTYRDKGTSADKIDDLLRMMEERLQDDEVLYIKLHPFDADKLNIDLDQLTKVKPYPSKYETYEFLTAVDTLITDYSSIMFDFLCTGRPIMLYTYDKQEYYEMRGLYEDIDDYPITQYKDAEALITAIHSDYQNINANLPSDFKGKYISYDSIEGTGQLIDFLFKNSPSDKVNLFSVRNEKDNVVFFAGALWDNGITSAFMNTLDSIDLSEKNYILYLVDRSVKPQHKYKLEELKIPYILSSGIVQYSFFEGVLTYLYLNTESFGRKLFRKFIESRIFKMYRRDFRRMYNGLEINQYIHYTGFERSIGAMLNAISGEKIRTTAFYHTDMFEEYNAKRNINLKTLTSMYQNIDQVVLVNSELKEPLLQYCPSLNNLIVLDNFLGYKKIRRDSEESIFSSLLGTPLQYGDAAVISENIMNKYGSKQLGIVNNRAKTLNVLRKHLFGIPGVLPYVDQHMGDFQVAINQKVNQVLKLDEELIFGRDELGHIYGITQLQLINDLYDPEIKVFINIGRFDVQKGHDRLIKAFAEVNRIHPETRLVIIAPHGPLKKQTIKWVKDAGVNGKVTILGGMKNPYALLRLCDAFVFSSLYEGLGLVVFESLAVGTNVITVDIPATTQGLEAGSMNSDCLPALVTDNTEESLTKGWLDYLESDMRFGNYDFEKMENKSLIVWEKIVN